MVNIHKGRVKYNKTQELESFVVSLSLHPETIPAEVKSQISKIFFHKRKEWEHEQEYRLMKRCPNSVREEYLYLGHALKFIILTSKLLNIDEVRYSKNINDIKEKIKKIEVLSIKGSAGKIPILIYGNGLFDYSLVSEDRKEELWNSEEGYDILVLGENCMFAL